MFYRVCSCGAYLDPGEICDVCRPRMEAAKDQKGAGKEPSAVLDPSISVSFPVKFRSNGKRVAV